MPSGTLVFVSDPALRRKLGSQGRAKVLREFDAERSANQLHDLFVGLVQVHVLGGEVAPGPDRELVRR